MLSCVSDSVCVDAGSADVIYGASVLLIASDSSGVMYASRRSSFYWMAAFCVGTAGDGFCAVSVSAAKMNSSFRASQMSTPEDVWDCEWSVRERCWIPLSSDG